MDEFLSSLTPQFFDALVIAAILIGGALAAVRLYRDFTRPLPPESEGSAAQSTASVPRSPSGSPDAERFKKALEEDSTI